MKMCSRCGQQAAEFCSSCAAFVVPLPAVSAGTEPPSRSRFVELTNTNGKPIAVNPDHVVTISDYDTAPEFPQTLVILLSGEIRARGEYAVVKAALEKVNA